ncbi:MAG: hypothetical protein ABL953_04475 [Ilumatobacteraceae bacterium]
MKVRAKDVWKTVKGSSEDRLNAGQRLELRQWLDGLGIDINRVTEVAFNQRRQGPQLVSFTLVDLTTVPEWLRDTR